MHCGFGVANGPWGERSPEPVKRHKNSVIIASPFTSSEVPVALAFTLFGLSPKRVKMNWHQGPNWWLRDAKTRAQLGV
jgi:hypothetical protein